MKYLIIVLLSLLSPSIVYAQYSKQPLGDAVNFKDFGAIGDNSHDDTANIQAAIDYGLANGLTAFYCPAGNYKTTSTIYLDPPGNLRSSRTSPTNFAFTASFFGDPTGGMNYAPCKILPTFSNDVGLLIGPGQGMRVSDIAVISQAGGYRGNQNVNGVGIGISGGSGGSSVNLISNTYVANFYALYKATANGACCLGDSNKFFNISGDNGYYGLQILNTQTYINEAYSPRLAATIAISSENAKTVSVFGGNLSAAGGQSASFGISSISAFSKTAHDNGFDYTFTATIASPDSYIPNVYNSYTIVTAHFGVIPLTMTAWNSGTSVGTFKIWFPWVFANYGIMDLTTGTDIQAEVAAVSTLYAAERVVIAQGMGISLDGVHIENPGACSSLFIATAVSAGASTNSVKNPFFNADPSDPSGTSALHCQQVFPFVGFLTGASVSLQGGSYNTFKRLLFEGAYSSKLAVSDIASLRVNMGVYDSGGYTYSQLGGYGQFQSEGRGFGIWDNNYFLPLGSGLNTQLTNGELTTPFCGTEPCPWTTPNLTPAAFAGVCPTPSGGGSYGAAYTCGTLGSLGSYPPIACRTVFKSVDWNTTVITAGIFKRSASCPGYSWGKNFTDATVGGTVTWSYKGQSAALYMDALSLSFMFPGLGISIDNGGGAVKYTVTGVQPDLGYVTVMNATSDAGAPLAGTKTTVYSCASSCTIVQSPFAWTAY